MRRSLPFVLFVLLTAAALPAQAQLLKKLEETLKKGAAGAAPVAGTPTPAAAPKPAATPEDGELPPPVPGDAPPRPGYLGATGDTDPAGGVKIDGFTETGKAKASGLKEGDRIIAVNGEKVQNAREFGNLMVKTLPGETITLRVNRGGKEQDLKVKLVDPPAEVAEPADAPAEGPSVVNPPGAGGPLIAPRATASPARASLGITVVTLTDALREKLGVPVRRGAVITMVRPGSPADRAGVPVNAVVVAMDGQMVANAEELVALIKGAKPGTDAELSYYVAEKLARKSVKLAPATVINTLPLGYGGEPPLNLGPPGESRPFLSKVEKVVAGLAKPAATPAANAADLVSLQQSYSNMQTQMKLLLERIDELEARVKSLEAAAAPKPAEVEATKAKPKEKVKVPTLEAPQKP